MLTFQISVDDHIGEYVQKLDAAIDSALHQSADEMAMHAKQLVRKETGSLADTIDAEPLSGQGDHLHVWSVNAGNTQGGYKGGGALNEVTGKHAGSPVDYAEAQEYGPGEHTPYLTPAAETGWLQLLTVIQSMVGGIT